MEPDGVQTYRFTREEYHRLGEAGIFDEDARVELLDGELIVMPPIGLRHILTVRKLNRVFSAQLSDRCVIDVQNPILLDEYSEPQPDIVLVQLQSASEVAQPDNALLVAEVAESSLGYDRGKKLKFCAAAGVREVWIFNLLENVIEAHHSPAGNTYSEERVYKVGERISPQAFPETSFAVEELLP